MKAWILEQQAQVESKLLSLVEVNTPHPQEDEVRLKILCLRDSIIGFPR